MEAVPRLPMINFELLSSPEKVQFGLKLKQYVASFYQEDPESYSNEIRNLEALRASAVWPSIDINNCQTMKKYYCQLCFLKSRFPMEEGQVASVYFAWKDDYTKMACSIPDINFELMCILINIGSVHSKLGAEDTRNTPEGMKMSCTHFQCAAWAFQTARESYGQYVSLIMVSSELLRGMQLMCLAQAQECILEKSLLDNRKATIIAKIAIQLCSYYRQALQAFQTGEETLVLDHLHHHKYVFQYLVFKIAYSRCIALLYQGQQAEEQQKMGERVAFYQAALNALEDCRKHMQRIPSSHQAAFKDTLTFTLDVVEGKRKAAANENEFIYHEDVPDIDNLQEIKGASLVKGIPFNIHDSEISGPDIFNRLIPMEAHEASSLYSEQKAELLRCISARVEEKDQEISEFLNSLRLEWLTQMKTANGINHDIADRAAAMYAKPNAIRDLVDVMAKLSNSYQEVEAMLKEIHEFLEEEEKSEKEYQEKMGKRPPGIIANDLSREASKYQEAHNKASDSNQNLHKAMTTHVANIKVLAQPLNQLRVQIPSLNLPDANIDHATLEQLETLVGKVEKMRSQRSQLMNQLREAIHQDDITQVLVTRQPDQTMEAVFEQELEKHRKTGSLIDQNLLAQHNICKAIVETYAKFTPSRKYIQDFLHKRNSMMSALIASHDTYDDLLGKANKGIEFYAKLETNVSKLLQRIKSACKVQQEEREQILRKNGHVETNPVVEDVSAGKPKLKDYLESMKDKKPGESVIGPQMQYPTSSMYPNSTAVWPTTPSENKHEYVPSPQGYTANYNTMVNSNNYGSHGYTQVNYSNKTIDQALSDKMTALKVSSNNENYDNVNSRAYNYPVNIPQTSSYALGPANLQTSISPHINSYNYSNPPTSYQTVSSTNYPYITTSEHADQNGTVNYTYSGINTTSTPPTTVSSTMSDYKQFPQQSNYYGYSMPTNSAAYTQQSQYYYDQFANRSQTYPYQYAGSDASGGGASGSTYLQSGAQYAQYPANQTNSYQSYNQAGNQYSSNLGYADARQVQPANYTAAAVSNANEEMGGVNATVTISSVANTQVPSYAMGGNTNQIQAGFTTNASQVQPVYTQPNASYVQATYNTTDSQANASYVQPTYNANDSQANAGYVQPTYNTVDSQANASYVQQTYNAAYPTSTTPGAAQITYDQAYNTMNPYNQTSNLQYNQPANYYNQYGSYTNSTYQQPTYNQPDVATQQATKKESSIDLLAGLDFSVSQAPLIPQKETKSEAKEAPAVKKSKEQIPNPPITTALPKRKEKILKRGEPFKTQEVIKQFLQEVDKFEKYVETLNVKTLSGPSTLDLKWKEVQDSQENIDGAKKSISIARCYPLKNRSPDILPFDYNRIELALTKDDYINASNVKDVNPYCMDFIVTQLPRQSTIGDFWSMVWEQQVETVVCLLSNNEMGQDIYWPSEVGKEITINSKAIVMLSCSEKEHWIERKINYTDPENKENRIITVLQYIAWPGSLIPTNPLHFIEFVKRIIEMYLQQKCSGGPVLIHCVAGVGRSGICTILLALLMEFMATAFPFPDISGLACKVSCARKNILRDREHLKFIYLAVLSYVQTLKKEYTNGDNEKAEEIVAPTEKSTVDPLSTLDPLWATRKS